LGSARRRRMRMLQSASKKGQKWLGIVGPLPKHLALKGVSSIMVEGVAPVGELRFDSPEGIASERESFSGEMSSGIEASTC